MDKSTTLQNDLIKIKYIVLSKLQNTQVKVYLFGSRTQKTAGEKSDIDIAILPLSPPLPFGLLSNIRDAIENSNIPYTIDLVDLSKTDQFFRNKVLKEGVIWKD